MAPRTRRAAAQKQNQYRISDDDENVRGIATTPGKKKFGGVLASLSDNIPEAKTSRISEKESLDHTEKESQSLDCARHLGDSQGPPSSVVISKANISFSPLPCPGSSRRTTKTKTKMNDSIDDGISAVSCDIHTPPDSKNRTLKSNGSTEEGFSSEDDDRTLELEDEDELDDDDQSETLGRSDEGSDDESSDGYDSESDAVEEEEDYEPEDDEYVPEDDEDSASEDDLDDYVEEEKPVRTRATKKVSCDTKIEVDDAPMNVSITTNDETVPHGDDATAAEETPVKGFGSKDGDTNLLSPEALEAVVVDDDEDIDDNDILVATIIEDGLGNAIDFDRKDEEVDHSKRKGPQDAEPLNDCGSPSDLPCMTRPEKGIFQESVTKSKVESAEEVNKENKKEKSISNEEEIRSVTQSSPNTKLSTPQKGYQKSKKSFFRREGSIRRGKWTLGSKIGVGSFGVVHVGMNSETGKLMAVKKFKVEGAAMKDIRQEVELMRSLDHINIVRYLGAEMDKTHLHIFQEWVPGGSVATLLSRFGAFSLSVIRSYLLQTLSGLAYLHENDIMHRDIKGSNILVNDDGVVKLADFGASKKLANLQDNMMMSLTVRGTPYFMAPEVFEEKYSAKADIWGIGCVAYQMITGNPPWKEKGFTNPISLFNHIKKHDGPPLVNEKVKDRLKEENASVFRSLNDLLTISFMKEPSSRPNVHQLLEHSFFNEVNDTVDEESTYSRGLFSPANDTNASFWSRSPDQDSHILDTPSPDILRHPTPPPRSSNKRSKSVVQWKSSFVSPPRPTRSSQKKNQSPKFGSPNFSPNPDTSDWPDWARDELQKRTLFSKESRHANPTVTNGESALSEMMGSLALSADTAGTTSLMVGAKSRQRPSTISTVKSKLVGMDFLEESTAKYEI